MPAFSAMPLKQAGIVAWRAMAAIAIGLSPCGQCQDRRDKTNQTSNHELAPEAVSEARCIGARLTKS